MKKNFAGWVISELGERAGVIVNLTEGKFASAHDLRRSFGTRWAPRVKPTVLQKLMRHANIQTTLKYYVAIEGDDIAEELWKNFAPVTANNETFNETGPKLGAPMEQGGEAAPPLQPANKG